MESQKNLISIPCPLHSSEPIQRIALDPDDEQQLYCLECILQQSDRSTPPSGLKNIKDFIDTAAAHYAQNRQVTASTSEVPPQYISLLSDQSHHLEELSAHIEEEKIKVNSTFNQITEEAMKLINQKRTEYLHSLDQQLFNLRYWYIFFDKQVKKAHPKEEDIPFLFPSKEDLITRIQKISNATQLMAFVRNIKEDLNEKKSTDLRRGKKGILDELYEQIQKLENEKPHFEDESINISSFREGLNKFMAEQLDRMFEMSNGIMDVKFKDFPESKILASNDFKVLKEWLPKESNKFNPKLIYRATRDGMNGNAFHKHCDGKGATYTIIKAQLNNSGEVHTVGGFLDQSWHQNQNTPIYSSNAFIFSLTSKNKFVVTSGSEAAYGYANQGPLFGGGYDLGVTDFAQGNYCAPCSYQGSGDLFKKNDAKAYNPNYAEVYFKVIEMEVYTLH